MAGLDENTKLYLPFDQNTLDATTVDGALEVLDSGTGGQIITQDTTAQLSTAQKKWGSSSLLLDGNSDYLEVPASNNQNPFYSLSVTKTIHGWVKHTDHSGTEAYCGQTDGGGYYWYFGHIHGTGLTARMYYPTLVVNASGGEIDDTNWHHVALIVVTDGSNRNTGIYLDGTQVGYSSATNLGNWGSNVFRIGWADNSAPYFDGNMDGWEWSNSNLFSASPVAELTDTITVPTAAPVADANSYLLLQMDTQDQSGDGGSGTYHIPDFIGTAQLDTDVTKYAGDTSSLLLDGDSDYIAIPDSADWDIFGSTTQDYTFDCWVRHTDHNSRETYIGQTNNDGGANFWEFSHYDENGLQIRVRASSSYVIATPYGGEITDSNWHHVAFAKVTDDGTNVLYGLYLDGVQVSYLNDTSTATFSSPLYLGAVGTDYIFDGNMAHARVQASNIFGASPVVGLTDTITVPTGPYSAGVIDTPINVPLGTLDVTALIPIITASDNKNYPIPLASLTLNSLLPVITATDNKNVTVPLGSLIATTYIPDVLLSDNQTVVIPLATLNLTELIPTITAQDNKVVTVPLGQISVVTLVPLIIPTAHKTIEVPAGSLIITSYAPTITYLGEILKANTRTINITDYLSCEIKVNNYLQSKINIT